MSTQQNLTPEAVPFEVIGEATADDRGYLTPVEVPLAEVVKDFQAARAKGRKLPLNLPVKTWGYVDWSTGGSYDSNRGHEVPVEHAELATSELQFQPSGASEVWHTPLLDIDVPAALVPSSTPGHSHLYIDRPMTWQTYAQLLHALCDAGIIEPGYLRASLDRGHTALRTPWTRKAAD